MEKIKKIFNKVFKEETKDRMRLKFKKLFIYFDKRLYYREYVKALKYILNEKIFQYSGPEYGYRYDNFLQEVRKEYIKVGIADTKWNVTDEEMRKAIDYVKENGLDMYCGGIDGVCPYSENDIDYDEENQLFYGWYEGKKLYFSEEFDTEEKALKYLNGLAAEQSENSPHRYLAGDFDVNEDDIVFDIGSAEGNFALSVIERAKAIYLFETEEIWKRPLELTFAPYREKVHIIQKYVSAQTGEKSVSIDDFCKENNVKEIGLIKMDVEGAEKDVLVGAKTMLEEEKIRKLAICTYHKMNDGEVIDAMLPNYKKTWSKGYMLGAAIWNFEIWNITRPYFTRGIMRARLNKK